MSDFMRKHDLVLVRPHKKAGDFRHFRPRLRRRNGFTLVELIVALLIAGIIITLAASFFIFGGNFLSRTEAHADDKRLTERTTDYIKERLLYATSIGVEKDDVPPTGVFGGDILYIGRDTDGDGLPDEIAETGHLYYQRAGESEPIDVFGVGDYRGSEIALAYSTTVDPALAKDKENPLPAKSFGVKAMAVRDGKQNYFSEQTFSLYDIGEGSSPTEDMEISSWVGSAGGTGTGGTDAGGAGGTVDAGSTTGEKFYLYINIAPGSNESDGYVTDGLIARFDAIKNVNGGALSGAHHDSSSVNKWGDLSGNGNDMELTFTSNSTPIRDKSLYFDGTGDFGKIVDLDLSNYSAVTVEVRLRVASNQTYAWPNLYEHSSDASKIPAGFRAYYDISNPGQGYMFRSYMGYPELTATAFSSTNHTAFMNRADLFDMQSGHTPHAVWINGVGVSLSGTNAANIHTQNFMSYPFFVATDGDVRHFFNGEIASVRIYGRALTSDEIAQNAAVDELRFG